MSPFTLNQDHPEKSSGLAEQLIRAEVPESDREHILMFACFLSHHPPRRPCDCGVPMRREGEHILAVANPDCDCPCHIPGWVRGEPGPTPAYFKTNVYHPEVS